MSVTPCLYEDIVVVFLMQVRGGSSISLLTCLPLIEYRGYDYWIQGNGK